MNAGVTTRPAFDPSALKRQFPGLTEPDLHYLDNTATSQMPEVVLTALRRFEIEARANVHEGAHRRARAATAALGEARSRVARFLHAYSTEEVVFTYGTTSSINMLADSFGMSLNPGDEIVLSVLEHHSNLVPWQRLAARIDGRREDGGARRHTQSARGGFIFRRRVLRHGSLPPS